MKKFLLLAGFVFLFKNVFASEQSLLSTWAIFRITHVKADTVDCNEKYFKEESFAQYKGRPVCEKIALGSRGTPAIRTLIGFLGKDGTRYVCKPFPELKQDEVFVISSNFDEEKKSFSMSREKEMRCFGCLYERRCLFFEIGHAECVVERDLR